MEIKNGKTFLPLTYDSFQNNKKKATKTSAILRTLLSLDVSAPIDAVSSQAPTRRQPMLVEAGSDDDLVDDNVTEKIVHSEYQRMLDEFENSRFEAINSRIDKEKQKLQQQTPTRTLSINSLIKDLGIQSIENISNLKRQLQVPIGRRNVDRIDSMLSFNKFFVILNRQKRIKIYDQCTFQQVEAGQQIYEEGEVEDDMYVVVKGCIRQYEKKNTSFHDKMTVNFVTHYEGSNFGDAQLIRDKNQKAKRHHTAIACEKTYLLKISNNFYRDLITNSAEDDFERKIGSLLSTSMFGETSKIFVTPLLSTLEKRILVLGEVLIKQGDPVRKLYFIGDGNLRLVYIDRSKRSIKHLNIEEKPKPFSLRAASSERKERVKKNPSIHHTFYYAKEQFEMKKQFAYGKKKIVGDELEYNDQIVFEELRNGDFLGGKSFLTPQQREQRSQKSLYFYPSLDSKLTVVGASISSTIYCLEQKKFFSLSDSLQSVIINGIMATTYFDERDIDTKVQAHREWKKYSQNLVAKAIAQKKNRNNSFRL